MRFVSWIAAGLAAWAGAAAAQESCGSVDAPCEVALGSYHIVLPAGDGPHPVMVFLHGFGSNGAAMIRNMGASKTATARGYAYIAPNGLKRPSGRGTGWSFHPDWVQQRDEPAFLRQILQDADARFDVDPDRAILAGFSIGGSMTSYLACAHPGDFAAYAPVGGSFWRAHPVGCKGPVRLLHTHGWRDVTVPLEGRRLGPRPTGEYVKQGDVFHAMNIWRAANGCIEMRADDFQMDDRFWRRKWTRCTPGTALEFVLHSGAHGVPRGWADMALDWYENLEDPGL